MSRPLPQFIRDCEQMFEALEPTSGLARLLREAADIARAYTETFASANISHAVEMQLRLEYWANHGCDPSKRYDYDGGEMLCEGCNQDFRKMPIFDLIRFVAGKRSDVA